ncbi:zinc finger protein ZPR1-like protein [Cucumis melo var. makuwa]|uniref:Zinc finger protein ZPR1-like protein n=1 Tax=Cucumis melo var. makuwa TaxID=1194695 RepID=A0A5D3C903_CUCMM|nr:zinc finger protein ZPR1-like protein [Cucumis melo var. makuwa]TYK08321.1 zinc finger protein ZPR1-like protein [Cucumis melo var. makuwa]
MLFSQDVRIAGRRNHMLELQSQPTLEGSQPLSRDEICDQVLGRRPGYSKGFGWGPKPKARIPDALYCAGIRDVGRGIFDVVLVMNRESVSRRVSFDVHRDTVKDIENRYPDIS